MEATETKRRIPRKRVRLVKVTVDSVEVDGKECTKCGVVKALTEYEVGKRGLGGVKSDCRECARKYREGNSERIRERNQKYYRANVEKFRKYYEANSEKIRKRREANPEKFRKYREANAESIRECTRKYYEDNPEKFRARDHRRWAMRRALPSNWAEEHTALILALSQSSSADVHIDHVIPLAWGHGGSYVGNAIPLSAALNISKKDSHVFHWFETNRQRFELDRSRFDRMISIVAAQNGLTPDEYRQYYDWCCENRRTVAQTKRDNAKYGDKRPSLDLWREATGIPFPIRIDFGEKKAETKRRVRTRKNPPRISASEA